MDPIAWQALVDKGFIDPFSPNDQLGTASGIHLGDFEGPEVVTVGANQYIYVTTHNGDGQVLMNMRGLPARFPTLTGVIETHDTLYLTTLFGNQLPRLVERYL